jgi:hypothetical protein
MIKRTKLTIGIIGCLFLSINFGRAVELLENGEIIIPDKTFEAIKIDAELSEKVWSNAPISKKFMTLFPLYGEVLGQETEVWTAYDSQNLYFAVKCFDTEPEKIKTKISKRDNTSRDDWIGVLIDTMGNRQTSYEFYVNPSGIQSDFLNSAVSGVDKAPDFVWQSAGKITNKGYQVEICIPLESIRFKSGKEVKMGILFVRNISRLGTVGAWPEIKAGQTDFNFMATIIYRDLKKRLKMEVLPNFTYSRNVERENVDSWERDIYKNIGVDFKYGVTSAITAEATINPDFSQVESDAFQVEVNRRYPVFYNEKRPFFMEGMNIFDFGIISEGMMISAVHTRRISDPGWAAKLTGTSGKIVYAVLAANDKSQGQKWESDINPNEGKDTFWNIARAKYNIGSDNSLGILYSGWHFVGGKNNVIGADLQYRFFKNARFNVSYLYSSTRETGLDKFKNGDGINAMLQYFTPKLSAWAAYERYDKDFTMNSAFQNRTNISRGVVYIGPNIYPHTKRITWLQKVQPYIQYSKLHDLGTKMDDTYLGLGFDLYCTRQGFLKIEFRNEKEAWQGQHFNQKFLNSFGKVQLFKWFYIEFNFRYGDQIYYGPEEPFLGTGNQLRFAFNIQPDIKLILNLEFVHNDLYKKADNQKFYAVDILNIHTTYQFNKYFLLRGAVRYNHYQKKLLTDFLASFTLIPGTVMHLGYGSLYENKEWQNNQWVPGQGGLLDMKNGLFFKVSYLWRIK